MVEGDAEPGILVRPRGVPARQRVQHPQRASRAGGRRHRRLAPAPAQRGDSVAVAHGGPRSQRTGARRLHRFEAHAGAEVQRRRGIREQQGQPFALGLEQLGVRPAGPRGQAPVDVAGVVAARVVARFGVLHPAAAQVGQGMPLHPAGATPRGTASVGQRAQRDQFGQRGPHARGIRHGPDRVDRHLRRACRPPPQGNGTRSSSSATRRSPSQPSAVAS